MRRECDGGTIKNVHQSLKHDTLNSEEKSGVGYAREVMTRKQHWKLTSHASVTSDTVADSHILNAKQHNLRQ